MKTAQRILDTAAGLFNERGERNVSASDVALELDISPGNLYYHFKGKDGILSALFLSFYRDIAGMLATPIADDRLSRDERTAGTQLAVFNGDHGSDVRTPVFLPQYD